MKINPMHALATPLIISGIYRWILYSNGVSVFSEYSKTELYCHLFSLICFGYWFWHFFVRERCPDCNGTSIHHGEPELLETIHVVRKVKEQDSKGRYQTRHLNVSVGKYKRLHKCRICGFKWNVRFDQDR